jgi:hypothetical protein
MLCPVADAQIDGNADELCPKERNLVWYNAHFNGDCNTKEAGYEKTQGASVSRLKCSMPDDLLKGLYVCLGIPNETKPTDARKVLAAFLHEHRICIDPDIKLIPASSMKASEPSLQTTEIQLALKKTAQRIWLWKYAEAQRNQPRPPSRLPLVQANPIKHVKKTTIITEESFEETS